MIEKMVEILCCPDCRGELEMNSRTGDLTCTSCNQAFGSCNGIFEMFRSADLPDPEFLRYRQRYEEHANEDLFYCRSDLTQMACLKTLSSFMNPCDGRLILDIGSADGLLGGSISGRVVCFDISVTYLKAAREKGLPVVAGKAETLPFRMVFDAVVLSNVLEHVPHPEKIMQEVKRVLKPGGSLYVVVPFKEDLTWHDGEDILDPHLTSFDLPGLKTLLQDFRIIQQKFILFKDFRPVYALKSGVKKLSPGWYRRLSEARRPKKPEAAGEFPEWKHALERLPCAIVLPFFRPYSILIKAERM